MLTRAQLTALAALVVVLVIGYAVATQTAGTPFRAEDGTKFADPVSGTVASLGNQTFEVMLDASDHIPYYTITVRSDTRIQVLGLETVLGSFSDLEIGDRVTVIPVADRNDYTREALYIDIFR